MFMGDDFDPSLATLAASFLACATDIAAAEIPEREKALAGSRRAALSLPSIGGEG